MWLDGKNEENDSCQKACTQELSQSWYRGGSSAGATGARASADIQQRVPGTCPEMSLSIKGSIHHQKVQVFEFKFHFSSKNWLYLESN